MRFLYGWVGALGLMLWMASGATAGEEFAEPVLVKAGDKGLGEGRLYPSPARYDIDGDGRRDLVVGDLWGKLTVATQAEDGTYRAEVPLKDAEGKPIDFENW